MERKRLNCKSLTSIKYELLSSLNYENVMEDLANKKARKNHLYQCIYYFLTIKHINL